MNILLIYTDQHRRDSLGCYGSPLCQTPRLDRLAAEGVTFDQAYTTSPICTPARASLQTGYYPFKHGMQTNLFMHGCMLHELADHPDLLSRRLQAAGYAAGYTGKWHLGYGPKCRETFPNKPMYDGVRDDVELPEAYKRVSSLPTDLGYTGDDFPGHGGGGESYPSYAEWLAAKKKTLQWNFDNALQGGEVTSGSDTTVSAYIAERTINQLQQFSKNDRPFFMMANFWGPHEPYMTPTEFLDLYRDLEIPPWESFQEEQANKPAIHAIQRSGKSWDAFEEELKLYYGHISHIDAEIGRILDALDEYGLAQNTLVLFSADHGDSNGCHGGLMNKSLQMYEETVAVPLIAKVPGGLKGVREDRFINTTDLYATVLDAAGDDGLTRHGRSFLGMVDGSGVTEWPEVVVTEGSGIASVLISQRMIRYQHWKYVFNAGDMEELYNLNEDPHERVNLAQDCDHPAALDMMRNKLAEWMKETDDQLLKGFLALVAHRRTAKPAPDFISFES